MSSVCGRPHSCAIPMPHASCPIPFPYNSAMRGRVAIPFLLFLLLAQRALPQCPYSRIASVPFRSTAYDVAIDGNDLWLASGYGAALYDRSVDPPRLTALTAVPQTTKLIRVANGTAYTGSGDSLAVVRKSGKQLQVAATLTAPGTINHLLLTPNYLYAATKNGIAQYDLLDPLHPAKTAAAFPTSGANVTSLAVIGSTLFAADGDASVELFDLSTPTSPQPRASIGTIARAATLHVINNRLYVSDGLQTDVILQPAGSPVSAAVIAIPTTSAASLTGDALFAGGNDRRVRAFDLAIAGSPVEIYRNETPASAGNVNRVLAMASAGGRLYVAAGDGGLVTYDTSAFTSPFALRSYTTSAAQTSVLSLGDHLYVTPASGGIVEYAQSASGALTQARTWDATHTDSVRDAAPTLLLTTSGANATLWTLTSTIPVAISSTTFGAGTTPTPSVTSAVLIGTTAIAVLSNGVVATADMSLEHPTPQTVTITGAAKIGSVTRSGNAVVFVQENNDATTSLFFFANTAALSSPTASLRISGTPVGTVALGGTTAAVFTFKGINIVDFSSGSVRTLAKSNSSAPLQLTFSGSSLLELTLTELIVWNPDGSGTVTARYTLPSSGAAVHVASGSTLADVATSGGVSSIALTSTSKLPSAFSAPTGNEFYKRVAAGGNRIYLFGTSVDILTNGLAFVGSAGSGVVDAAANAKGLFTINGSSVVTAWSPDGVALKTAAVTTASDAQPLAIFTAGNAVWVSLSRGCLSGGCEKVTLVLDPATLAQSDQLTGGVTDVSTVGTHAYVLTDFPREIRVYDIGNPAHPVQTAMRAITDTNAPVSIAGDATNVFTLGERLATYTAASLTPTATQLDPFTGVSSANVYADQRLRGDAPCLLLSGRNADAIESSANPAAWTGVVPIAAPSFVRGAAYVPGTFYLMTDHSLEVYSTSPLPKPAKRHASN